LQPEDRLSSFIKKKGCYDKATKQVTALAFLPRLFDRYETSVFRTTGLDSAETWRLGHLWTVVNALWDKSGNQDITGRADILAKNVTLPLRAEMVPSPHPEHADILGWDSEDSARDFQALSLAQAATYVSRN
jgi:hypothetical protein